MRAASMAKPLSEAVLARLAEVGAAPEGLLAHEVGAFGQIAIARTGADVVMAFCPLGVPLSNQALSGVMARIDPADPLVLKGQYTQVMMAALVFRPDPGRVYVMGAGGGRVPLVLHHLVGVPEVLGAELDPQVIALSRAYLGLETGDGLQIDCADGRAHLARQAEAGFDHIYVDCYSAHGRVPAALSTVTFFELCAAKLAPGGVLVMNLIAKDDLYPAQMAGILASFAEVYAWEQGGSVVVFATAGAAPDAGERAARAAGLAQRLRFGFDLEAHVAGLRRIPRLGAGAPISDAQVFDPDQAWRFFAPDAFAGCARNAACPCGSGRKFKVCHGRK